MSASVQPPIAALPATLAATVPPDLLEAPRWIVFSLAWVTDTHGRRKLKKTPYNPRTGNLAKVNDARTWATYGEACRAVASGKYGELATLGYALGDGIAGIDLDKCREPEAGALTPEALAIVRELDSYTEVSPSGTGVHTLVRGALPDTRGRRRGPVEMYADGRFFTITGDALEGAPRALNERTDALAALHTRTFAHTRTRATKTPDAAPEVHGAASASPASSTASPAASGGPDDMSDSAILARACAARVTGEGFERLYRGDMSGYPSASEADWALICDLRFWTQGDAAQMDSLFRQSGLMREKWDTRHFSDGATYGEETIRRALTGPYKVWTPRASRGSAGGASRGGATAGADRGPTGGGELAPDMSPDMTENGKRRICVNAGEPGEVCRAVIAELYARHADTRIFQRSGHLVSLRADVDGRMTIQELSEDRLRALVEETMRCYTIRAGKGKDAPPQETNVLLSRDLARMILAASAWPFPTITGVSSVPIVRPDGSICATPGYDPQTRRFYAPRADVRLPAILEAPTQRDARRAAARLLDIYRDFPFANRETDTANALAFVLTPLLRAAIHGPVPLAVVDATRPGSGKSKLMTLLAMQATGAPRSEVGFNTWPNGDEPEARKKLTSLLASGVSLVAFDNVTGVLHSPTLDAMLTAHAWQDRLLGTNEQPQFPIQTSWIVTGNGMRLGSDLFRRTYWIRLDAPMAHPETRGEDCFTIPDIESYVESRLGELLADLLTIIRAWYAAGSPRATAQPVMGSYEAWVRIMAGILGYAGVGGFLATLQEDLRLADEESDEWGAFFLAWHETYGNAPVRVNEAARYMEGNLDALMCETLPAYLAREYGKPGKGFRVALGSALRSRAGRRYGEREVRIVRAGYDPHSKTNMWRVELSQARQTPAALVMPDYSPDTVTYDADAEDGRELAGWGDEDADAAPYAPDASPDEDGGEGGELQPVGETFVPSPEWLARRSGKVAKWPPEAPPAPADALADTSPRATPATPDARPLVHEEIG